MDIFLMILLMLAGVVLLLVGANLFVDGAGGIAKKLKISAFVIGMTVVALGTSAPELAVSIKSAMSNSGDVLMGNIVGSNIFNILLILGISALICRIPVKKNTLTIELPFLLIVTVLFLLFATIGGRIFERWEGGVLIALFAAYMTYMIIMGLRERKKEKALLTGGSGGEINAPEPEKAQPVRTGLFGWYDKMKGRTWFLIIITLAGLAGVVFGADIVVNNVNGLADMIENENARKILSVTIVALGTSLPELVTSVTAAVKGDTDIALGNIIGSNIFNIIFIGGLPMLIFSVSYTSDYLVDMIIAAAAVMLLAICVLLGKGKNITRLGGALMLAATAGYLVYLFIA